MNSRTDYLWFVVYINL